MRNRWKGTVQKALGCSPDQLFTIVWSYHEGIVVAVEMVWGKIRCVTQEGFSVKFLGPWDEGRSRTPPQWILLSLLTQLTFRMPRMVPLAQSDLIPRPFSCGLAYLGCAEPDLIPTSFDVSPRARKSRSNPSKRNV